MLSRATHYALLATTVYAKSKAVNALESIGVDSGTLVVQGRRRWGCVVSSSSLQYYS